MADVIKQTAQDVELPVYDIDEQITEIIESGDWNKAVGCIDWIQGQIGANCLRLGRIACHLKATGKWHQYADESASWMDFLIDRTFFKVGPSSIQLYMRLWKFYCKKFEISVSEAGAYSLDALDAAKPLMLAEGWDATKGTLTLKQGDLREEVKDRTGKEPDWSAYTDRVIGQVMKLRQSAMVEGWEVFLRETGLNHFTHQKKCAICDKIFMIEFHHDPPKSQGGKGIGDIILCSECHRLLHDGKLTEEQWLKYKAELKKLKGE